MAVVKPDGFLEGPCMVRGGARTALARRRCAVGQGTGARSHTPRFQADLNHYRERVMWPEFERFRHELESRFEDPPIT